MWVYSNEAGIQSSAINLKGVGGQSAGVISMSVKGDGQDTDSKIAEIDYNSIDNLNRALQTPDSIPTKNSDNLITSNGVYNELQDRPTRDEVGRTVRAMLILAKSSYPTACQGQIIFSLNFQEYIETYTDANRKLWTIYLWDDGSADYFTISSPANLAVHDRIYEYTQQSIDAIKNNTNSDIENTLAQFVFDEVANI